MGHREVRRVPMDWEHPRRSDGKYAGLAARDILAYYEPGEELGRKYELMPEFPEGTATGWQLYETTSEGTPVSPVFATAEELAAWCEDGATVTARLKWTREQWLQSFRDESTDVQSLLFIDSSGMHTGIPSAGE